MCLNSVYLNLFSKTGSDVDVQGLVSCATIHTIHVTDEQLLLSVHMLLKITLLPP